MSRNPQETTRLEPQSARVLALLIVRAGDVVTREELQQRAQQPAIYERTERLAAAAQALLPDYTTETELTSFTVLDSEDFYEAR